jgi:hypothetical protein
MSFYNACAKWIITLMDFAKDACYYIARMHKLCIIPLCKTEAYDHLHLKAKEVAMHLLTAAFILTLLQVQSIGEFL